MTPKAPKMAPKTRKSDRQMVARVATWPLEPSMPRSMHLSLHRSIHRSIPRANDASTQQRTHGINDRFQYSVRPRIHRPIVPATRGSIDPATHGHVDPSVHEATVDPWIHRSIASSTRRPSDRPLDPSTHQPNDSSHEYTRYQGLVGRGASR